MEDYIAQSTAMKSGPMNPCHRLGNQGSDGKSVPTKARGWQAKMGSHGSDPESGPTSVGGDFFISPPACGKRGSSVFLCLVHFLSYRAPQSQEGARSEVGTHTGANICPPPATQTRDPSPWDPTLPTVLTAVSHPLISHQSCPPLMPSVGPTPLNYFPQILID